MRRIVLAALAAALLGGGIWFLTQGGEGTDPAPLTDGEGTDGSTVVEHAPVLEGSGTQVGEGGTSAAGDGARRRVAVGRGLVRGQVTLNGEPAEANVSIRQKRVFDTKRPLQSMGRGAADLVATMLGADFGRGPSKPPVNTDAEGRFVFSDLAPGLYEVVAQDDAGRRITAAATLPADGARVEVTLELPAGPHTLAGKVSYPDARVFQGLVVLAPALRRGMGPFGPILGVSTRVADDGTFSFAGLQPGMYAVTALIPGKLRVMRGGVTVPANEPLEFVLGAGERPLEGKVLAAADNDPIAGATVVSGGGDEGNLVLASTRTDAEGAFSLLAPPADGGMIVSAKGFATRFIERRGTNADKPVILLEALGTVRGRVLVEGTDTPVAGVEVVAMPQAREGIPSLSHGVTDASGAFVIDDVGPGMVSFLVHGQGYVNFDAFRMRRRGPSPPGAVQLEAGGEAETTLFATKAATVHGRVTDASGKPVAGAVVRAGEAMGMGMMMAMLGGGSLGTTVTDADGRYRMTEVMPRGSARMTASAPGHADVSDEARDLVAGGEFELDLQFAVARRLRVRVLDKESGEPIEGATVMLQGDAMLQLMRAGGAVAAEPRTDADGMCVLEPLPEGTLNLQVDAPTHLQARQSVEIGESEETVTVTLERGTFLVGRLTAPEGVEVGGIRVRLQAEGRRSGRWIHERTSSDIEGRFRFERIPPGNYKITARVRAGDRYYEASASAEAGSEDELELRLEPGDPLKLLVVQVVGPEGKPVPSGSIELERRTGGSSGTHSRSFSEGRAEFEMQEVPEVIVVTVSGMVGLGARVVGPIPPPASGSLEVQVQAAVAIRGVVVDDRGEPVPGVLLSAKSVPAEGSAHRHARSLTEAASVTGGTFELAGLSTDEYEVHVEGSAAYLAPATPLRVRGGTEGVRIELGRANQVEVTVLTANGSPLPGAQVWLRPAQASAGPQVRRVNNNSQFGYGRADAKGVARLGGIVPGQAYTLDVRPPDGDSTHQPYERKDWIPENDRIRMAAGSQVAGRLSDEHGAPIAGATIQVSRPGEEEGAYVGVQGARVQTDEDGRFEVGSLPLGRLRLDAQVPGLLRDPWGEQPERVTHLDVRAGDTSIRWKIPLGEKLVLTFQDPEVVEPWHSLQIAEESANRPFSQHLRVGKQGTIIVFGLKRAAKYTVSLFGLEGGRYIRKTGIQVGDRVSLEVVKGLELAGRVELPDGVSFRHIGASLRDASGNHMQLNAIVRAGRFRFQGVPAGRYTVRVWAQGAEETWEGTAEGDAGATDVTVQIAKR